MYQCTCSENKAPDDGDIHRSLHTCESSACDVFLVTLPALRIFEVALENLFTPLRGYIFRKI